MSIQISPLSQALGASISGLDPKHLGQSERDALYQAFLDYGVLLIPEVRLTPSEHVELSRIFGETEIHPIESIRHPEEAQIIVLSANAREPIPEGDPAGEEIVGQIPWHTDLTYTTTPSRGALLYARVVPEEGGRTGWIDTAHVYDELSETMKHRIEGLRVVHSFASSRAAAKKNGVELPEFPDVIHPLVYEHPENGRKVLNISPNFAQSIVDMPGETGDSLLAELKAFATQDQFAYVHDWAVGDLVVWDNRRTMHRAFGYKKKFQRVMHRTTLKGDFVLGEEKAA